jgi:glutamate-1-semialdehyde 2,1-aminomutase
MLKDRIKRTNSEALFSEAKQYFPGGVNSPVRAFKSVSGAPLFIKKGSGYTITDEDDNQYTDFCNSWGPLILGHNNEAIREAVIATIHNGMSFGTPTNHGNELGKFILDHNRYIDRIRFVSSGTEAVMSAIRLARGYTGRKKIIKFEGCYHGHVDALMVKAGSGLATFGVSTSAGIPESFAQETIVLPLDDEKAVEQCLETHAADVACIIIEPVPANNGLLLQRKAYLEFLREICDKHNVLLIFDEVISGFRVGFEGAAGYYGIEPDLITYGKIIGGGLPVGAFGGKQAIMEHVAPLGAVYQAGTLSANPVAMTAGLSCLKQLIDPDFYPFMAKKTNELADALEAYAAEKGYVLTVPRIGSIFWLCFSKEAVRTSAAINADSMEYFKILHHELLQTGVYLGPSGYEVGFLSTPLAHDQAALDQAIELMKKALDIAFQG